MSDIETKHEAIRLSPEHTVEIVKTHIFIGGSGDSHALTLFQSVNLNIGAIRWVHVEVVKGIVSAKKRS